MLIALIADIHGNLPALEAVIRRIVEIRPDRLYFLGDAVGYGPWPAEVTELIRRNVHAGVIGNHDAGVVNRTDVSNYYDAVRYVIDWSRDQMNEQQRSFLAGLKHVFVDETGLLLCAHGSPRHPEQFDYLYSKETVATLYEVEPFLRRMIFVAHSHFFGYFVLTGEGKVIELDLTSGCVNIDFLYPSVCIVGSVGQPRDGDPRAGFVTFDTEKMVVQFHRVSYDVEKTVTQIKKQKLPRTFADRLPEGR